MNNFKLDEIEYIINNVPNNKYTQELSSVIFSLGRDIENAEEYDYALSKLISLFNRENESVKADVVQAFSLIAILKKHIKLLNREIVEPLIYSAWNTVQSKGNKEKIKYSVEDINFSLNWNISL